MPTLGSLEPQGSGTDDSDWTPSEATTSLMRRRGEALLQTFSDTVKSAQKQKLKASHVKET